jgi:hypothetical protein
MPAFVLGAIVLFTALLGVFATALVYLVGRTYSVARRHVRQRRAQPYRRPLSDREVAVSGAPFAQIESWPVEPPVSVNGSGYERVG